MFQLLLPPRSDRGVFIAAMKERDIGIGVHYPALHLFSLYRARGFKDGDFPVAEDIGRRTITLPLFPDMADDDVERVCVALGEVLASPKFLKA
jgi:dTDP-4-amino-4,6-dideoxygalactose transaminase